MTCKMNINPLSFGCKLQKTVKTGTRITKTKAENGIEITREEDVFEDVCTGCYHYREAPKEIKTDDEAKLQAQRIEVPKQEQEMKSVLLAEPTKFDKDGFATMKDGTIGRDPKLYFRTLCPDCKRQVWVKRIPPRGDSGPTYITDRCECKITPRTPWDDKHHPKSQ